MAEPLETLYVQLSAKIDDLEGKIGRAMSGAERAAQAGETRISNIMRHGSLRIATFGDNAAAASVVLGTALAGLGAALGGVGIMSVKLAGDMESSQTAFTQMLGSAEKADVFLKEMFEFAAKTPFEFIGLQKSARTFMAFGAEANQIIPIMTAVGDAVAGVGGGEFEIARVTRALTQMLSLGRVSAEEMNQLAEVIPGPWQLLAEGLGITMAEARTQAEKGLIGGAQAVNIMLTGMGQKFAGQMEKQSTTINGMMSTLKDNTQMIMASLGKTIVETFDLKPKMAAALEQLSALNNVLQQEGLQGAFKKLFPPETQTTIIAIAGAIAGMLLPAIMTMALALGPVVLSLGAFAVAGAAVAILGAKFGVWDLVAAIFGRVGDVFESLIKSITPAFNYLVALAEGKVVGGALTQVDTGLRGIVEALGQVVSAAREVLKVFGDFANTVKHVKDNETAMWLLASAVTAVGLALLALKIGAIIAGIVAAAGAVAGLISALITLGPVIAILVAFAAISLAPIILAITTLSLIIGALATNFMGARDVVVKALAIMLDAIFQFATLGVRGFIMLARGLADLLEKIPGMEGVAAAIRNVAGRIENELDEGRKGLYNFANSLLGVKEAAEEATPAVEQSVDQWARSVSDAGRRIQEDTGAIRDTWWDTEQAAIATEGSVTYSWNKIDEATAQLESSQRRHGANIQNAWIAVANEAERTGERIQSVANRALELAADLGNRFSRIAAARERLEKQLGEDMPHGLDTAVDEAGQKVRDLLFPPTPAGDGPFFKEEPPAAKALKKVKDAAKEAKEAVDSAKEAFEKMVNAMDPARIAEFAEQTFINEQAYEAFKESMREHLASGDILHVAEQFEALGKTGLETFEFIKKSLEENFKKAEEEIKRRVKAIGDAIQSVLGTGVGSTLDLVRQGLADFEKAEWIKTLEKQIAIYAAQIQERMAQGLDYSDIVEAMEPVATAYRAAVAKIDNSLNELSKAHFEAGRTAEHLGKVLEHESDRYLENIKKENTELLKQQETARRVEIAKAAAAAITREGVAEERRGQGKLAARNIQRVAHAAQYNIADALRMAEGYKDMFAGFMDPGWRHQLEDLVEQLQNAAKAGLTAVGAGIAAASSVSGLGGGGGGSQFTAQIARMFGGLAGIPTALLEAGIGELITGGTPFHEGGVSGRNRARGDIIPALLQPRELVAAPNSIMAQLAEMLSQGGQALMGGGGGGPLSHIAVIAIDDAGMRWLEAKQRKFRDQEDFRRGANPFGQTNPTVR